MTATPEVVVVGNVGVDTNVYLHTDEIDFSVEANFVETADYIAHAGGIVSRAYAQLGEKVRSKPRSASGVAFFGASQRHAISLTFHRPT